MNRHLTEQELIEFQFKLASDVQRVEISSHLEGCARCRENLEKLQRKFSSLDLLREEVKASDDLISHVVKQAGQPVRSRIISFRKPAWLSAAAAVLLVGSFLLIANLYKDEDKVAGPEIVNEPGLSKPVDKMELVKEEERARASSLDKKFAMTSESSHRSPKSLPEVMRRADKIEKDESLEGQISERPPFAPASAIELVVLPRRDSVQLTIYNSTFQTLKMLGGYGGYGGGLGGYGYGGGGYGVKLDEATSKAIEEAMKRGQQHQIPSSVAGGDVTLVRERRSLTLKKGWNWLQFMWANTLIDPTSLYLVPLAEADKVDIQQLVFPARLRELGRWLIRSQVSGQVPFEITYFTSGLSWRAFYMGTLAEDEKTMKLQGYVRVGNNSGEDYENAQTRLIVGNVHILDKIAELAKRQYPYGRPIIGRYGGRMGMGGYAGGDIREGEHLVTLNYLWADGMAKGVASTLKPKEIKKEGLSEYFLYSIEGTETIADKWGKRLLSFEAEDIKVQSLYKYDEERWGPQAIRFVSFANDEEHKLGQTPIPNGNMKIYNQADTEGYLSYVGGTDIKYIPVNEEVELNLGPARLVKVEPKLMDFKTENYVYDRKGNITGWDEVRTWDIKITNTRKLPIELEITRGFGTSYWTLRCDDKDISYEKHDATHARFKVNLEPRSKRTLGYTVTTYHGVREETVTKIKK
jgi:hypothetical protein